MEEHDEKYGVYFTNTAEPEEVQRINSYKGEHSPSQTNEVWSQASQENCAYTDPSVSISTETKVIIQT